jgi:hypothetical protein
MLAMPDEDPPGAWEAAMRDLDAHCPHRDDEPRSLGSFLGYRRLDLGPDLINIVRRGETMSANQKRGRHIWPNDGPRVSRGRST